MVGTSSLKEMPVLKPTKDSLVFVTLVAAIGSVSLVAVVAAIILLFKAPVIAVATTMVTATIAVLMMTRWITSRTLRQIPEKVTTAVATRRERVRLDREREGLLRQKIERGWDLDVVAMGEFDGVLKVATRKRDDPRGTDLYAKRSDDYQVKSRGAMLEQLDHLGFACHPEWWNPEYHHDHFDILTLITKGSEVHLFRPDGNPVSKPYATISGQWQ